MLSRSRSIRTLGLAAALAVAPLAAGPGGEASAQVLPRSVFGRDPRTPLETWEVANYLIRVGQPEQAAPYVKKFLDANPDDATLLEVRDTYGAGSVLRLADDPATRPYARRMADRLAKASVRHATDPARMARFIDALSKSSEEQAYAVERLREAGPFAIPPLVKALSVAGLDPSVRNPLVENMGRLDRKAVPALIATLDSPDAKLVSDVAKALGRIGDVRAVPALTNLAARKPETIAMPMVEQAILELTGKPFKSQPKTPARVLSDQARRYHLHAVKFPGDPIVLWLWDDAAKVPAPVSMSVRDAEGLLGIRAAREAIALDPTDTEAQVTLIGLGLDHAPADWKTAALAAGPDILGRVVRTAISDGRPDLARKAIEILGVEVDRNELLSESRPTPLVEALQAPDRLVLFAAAEALIKLDPRRRFAGSSRVLPILARFVSSQAEPRAIVVDGNGERGAKVSGFLREVGYNAQVAATGAQAFTLAAESADVELIAIDPNLVNDPWRLPDLLGNLKADARTAGIPVWLTGPLALYDKVKPSLQGFPEVRFLVTPSETTLLKAQLDRGFASMGVRPLTAQERTDYARRAASMLAKVARQPGSPFEPDLASIEPALALALNGPVAGTEAAVALGDVPGRDAQRSLADVALDASRAVPLRVVAAEQLARSVSRFGPRLAGDQERRLVEELAQEANPALRDALANVVGALRRGPDASSSRLQTYRSSSP